MPSAIPSASDNTLYTVEEVQDILRLTRRTLYTYLRSGTLEGVKFGRVWRITADSVRQFLADGVGVQRWKRRRQGQAFKSMTAEEILKGELPTDSGNEEYLIKGLLETGPWKVQYTARQTLARFLETLKSDALADSVGDMVFCFHELPKASGSSGSSASSDASADAADAGTGADAAGARPAESDASADSIETDAE